MYYIYVDEAGTSAKEKVTVVVGVLIHADRHWRLAAKMLSDAIDAHVPEQLRANYIFHAKDVWSGHRKFDGVWSREQRCDFIGEVAAIPRKLKTAISLGRVRRDAKADALGKLKRHDRHHLQAFWHCVRRANKYVRDWGTTEEVATLVAEDVPDKRRFLRAMLNVNHDVLLRPSHIALTETEKRTGIIMQTNSGPIDRVVDTVHFAGKREAPLLQLADACAFSFRRYFSQQDFGVQLVTSMLGRSLDWADWQGPCSEWVFGFNPSHNPNSLTKPLHTTTAADPSRP